MGASKGQTVKEAYAPFLRMWCNGSIAAFQAVGAGSSPVIRSKPLWALRRKGGETNMTAYILWYVLRLERLAASWRFIHTDGKTCDSPLLYLCFITHFMRRFHTAATDT